MRQLKLPVQPAPSTAWRKDNTSPEGLCQSGEAGARRGLFDGLGRLSMLQCPNDLHSPPPFGRARQGQKCDLSNTLV